MRPLKDGVIADFEITESMLRYFIKRANHSRFTHPRVVVCVPSGVTGVEKRAVEEACLGAGAREAYLIEEPMAAAIGSGLPVSEPTGSLIVDIGGGTTEVAVISLGDIVVSQSIRVGGDEMDDAIMNFCKREHQLLIGHQTAEDIKHEAGSAAPLGHEVEIEIRGRDLASGLPGRVKLNSENVRKALDEPIAADHRGGPGHPRPHAARARRRPDGAGHDPGGRRRPPPGDGRADERGVPDAGDARRVPAHLRGHRVRAGPRGVRGDQASAEELQCPEAVLRAG